MDASNARTALTLIAATIALVATAPGLALANTIGSTAPSTGSSGDGAPASPFQGVPSWLLIVVGIVVIAFAIRVVARRDEGNPGRGGGRDRGTSDRPRRPFRPD